MDEERMVKWVQRKLLSQTVWLLSCLAFFLCKIKEKKEETGNGSWVNPSMTQWCWETRIRKQNEKEGSKKRMMMINTKKEGEEAVLLCHFCCRFTIHYKGSIIVYCYLEVVKYIILLSAHLLSRDNKKEEDHPVGQLNQVIVSLKRRIEEEDTKRESRGL